jgi:hypothetical protein
MFKVLDSFRKLNYFLVLCPDHQQGEDKEEKQEE